MNFGQWIGLLALIASLYILWEIRQFLLLFFAAVVIATALNKLARWLQQFGLRRTWAVLLSIGFLAVVSICLFLLIVPPFAREFQELTVLVPEGITSLNRQVDQLRTNIPNQFTQYIPNLETLIQQAQPLVRQGLGRSFTFFSSSLGAVLKLLLVVVLTLMLVANPTAYRKGFILLFPSFYRRRADEILTQCEISLGRWIVGALIGMGVIAVLSGVSLRFLGVRASLAHGVLAGLLNFIPNVGPVLSVVPPMAIALLDAPWKSLVVLAIYFGIQQFESNLLTPLIMAKQVSLLPAVTLLAQVLFASLFGFLGLALALPLTVVGQIWVREMLIKDVLDRWHSSRELGLSTSSPASGVSTFTNEATEAHIVETGVCDSSDSIAPTDSQEIDPFNHANPEKKDSPLTD